MAIKLRTVYYATKEKYEMKLLTGNSGLDRLFSWVHILENIDTMDYLHGNEIVITTGIGKDSDQWLEEYVKKVVNSSATALIINTGKFINQIPPDLIKYCQTKNFPLFTVPWRIHLIDIIRDYCNRIFLSEQFAFSLTESIKNAIFHPENQRNLNLN
ncbi:PucR family transcriptional regulator ligand-binding domain-containing protein [Liquorilactobacillus vini]|uniref:PucR family transcriptional regulator ligand-binding domain-containing protein n=1 Tax=Liquorilactobacillus vini TaxID=238015 RepID=UPI000315D54D|nr:PucR family transcriptional regulator ligand-binding domain-containing protein [Liquorilactobacillus vini]